MMTLGGGPFYESRAGTCHKDLDLDSENFNTEFIPLTYSLLSSYGYVTEYSMRPLLQYLNSTQLTRPRDMFDEEGCPSSLTHMLYVLVAQGHGSPALQTQTYDRPALYIFGHPAGCPCK